MGIKKNKKSQKCVDVWWGEVLYCVTQVDHCGAKVKRVDQKDIGLSGFGEASGIFVGKFEHSLDPKKRLTIPAEWREYAGIPTSLYVLPSLENARCLSVYPAREMVQRLQRIRSLSIADTQARQFARVLGSQSQLAPWDSAGRIRIKDDLLEYAQLGEQVILVGAIERFELWNPELWKQTGGASVADLGEAARNIGF
jgi:MraZ protein